jgi:hypothetical protein
MGSARVLRAIQCVFGRRFDAKLGYETWLWSSSRFAAWLGVRDLATAAWTARATPASSKPSRRAAVGASARIP